MKRYTIKLVVGENITNIYSTNDFKEALKFERYYRKNYGSDKVWMVDNFS